MEISEDKYREMASTIVALNHRAATAEALCQEAAILKDINRSMHEDIRRAQVQANEFRTLWLAARDLNEHLQMRLASALGLTKEEEKRKEQP